MFNALSPNNKRQAVNRMNRGRNIVNRDENPINVNNPNTSFEQMVKALNQQQQQQQQQQPRAPNMPAMMEQRAPNMPAMMGPRAPNMPAMMGQRAPNMPAMMGPRAPNMPAMMGPRANNIKPMNINSTIGLKVPENIGEVRAEPVLNANQLAKKQRNQNIARRKVNVTQFLYKTFTFLNQLKLYHWQTRSYSRHIATDKLFSELVESIDEFVETYMGRYKRMYINEMPNIEINLELENMNDDDMYNYLRDEVLGYFSADLKELIGENDTDLANIKDEIIGKINQTLYLFTLKNGANRRNIK